MSLETAPPFRHISSQAISVDAASSILETYLHNSESHPHLHPDALITPTGVTFSSHGGPMGGVVMHNLRRVAAGLRGEYLEPEATPEPEGDGDDAAFEKKGRKGKGARKGAQTEEWTDTATYAEEEGLGIETGEIGDRSNFVQEGGEEPEVEATQGGKKRKGDAKGEVNDKLDKAARKKAKKDRDLKRKRDNAKKTEKQAE
ncbi:hypothetical protein ACN47E_001140 [Coniothyrium glycines]